MRWIIALIVLATLGGGAWVLGNRAEATATSDAPQIQATAGEAMDCCPMQAKAKEDCPACPECPAQ